MPGTSGRHSIPPVDARVAMYLFVRYVVVLAACALLVKYLFLDTVALTTDQMSPTLVDGDRVALLRTPFIRPFNRMFLPARGAPVVVRHPLFSKKYACLRVAGLPGDTVAVGKGRCMVNNRPSVRFGAPMASEEALPPAFSPRDSMPSIRLPPRGDVIGLESLSLRDFFFYVAIIKQDDSGGRFRVRSRLCIDGKPVEGFVIADFSLYKGTLDTVPERFEYDWFFWDRLREYCSHVLAGKDFSLEFGLFTGAEKVTHYRVKKSFIFLLADDWRKGFDSRYFGPVPVSSIKGRPVCILWSWAHGEHGGGFLRIGRTMKIVK